MATEVVEGGEVFVYEDVAEVLGYWLTPEGEVHVAVDAAGDVLGTSVVRPNQPGRGAHVANAGYMVARAHQGRGVGRLLAAHSIDLARGLGYRAMQFNMVVATNRAGRALWERLGFRLVGELPGAFRHARLGFVSGLVYYREL